jgi:hypothetical protein
LNKIGFCLVFALAAAAPAPTAVASPVFADSRDEATLLPQYLVNRDLIAQLSAAEQSFRLAFNAWKSVALAGDLAIGAQQNYLSDTPQTRFHGFDLARIYASAMAFRGLEASLNVLFFNPSASDPYRSSSQISAGLALHAYGSPFRLAGHPLRLDLVGTDLDWVTLGRGLFVERLPLQGVMAGASWRSLSFRYMFAGRALWDDDDLVTMALSALDGRAQIMHVQWQTNHAASIAKYLSGCLSLPLASRFSIGAEAAFRYDKGIHQIRGGALLRADAIERRKRFEIHVGYQLRWYQDGFGPRDDLLAPTSTFNVPYREDVYVTNSHEYLGLSAVYEQWSHTGMLEARVLVLSRVQLFADAEAWWRFAAARAAPWVVYTPDGFRAPGRALVGYYRAGVRVFPWPSLPHRLSAYVTNKQVQSGLDSSNEVARRFDRGTYCLFTVEAFL